MSKHICWLEIASGGNNLLGQRGLGEDLWTYVCEDHLWTPSGEDHMWTYVGR